jgi:hypothetical protein
MCRFPGLFAHEKYVSPGIKDISQMYKYHTKVTGSGSLFGLCKLPYVAVVNAENAVHRSKKFAAMAARTRREALKDLAENHVTAHSNDGPSRIASKYTYISVLPALFGDT